MMRPTPTLIPRCAANLTARLAHAPHAPLPSLSYLVAGPSPGPAAQEPRPAPHSQQYEGWLSPPASAVPSGSDAKHTSASSPSLLASYSLLSRPAQDKPHRVSSVPAPTLAWCDFLSMV